MNSENLVSSSFKLAEVIKADITPLDDDEVRNKVALISNWWATHPNYVMEGQTVGRFVETNATSYYYEEGGVSKYKVDYNTIESTRSHMVIINEGGGNIFIYWPETDGYVNASFVVGYEEGLASLQGIDPGLLNYENVLFSSTTSRVCVDTETGFELHLSFNSVDVGLNPPGTVDMIIHATDEGQITRIDQNRMGVSQSTTMTYREYPDSTGVLAEIDVVEYLRNCPDSSVRTADGEYEEEVQKNVLYFRFEAADA